jgi:hypothetical protein
MNYYEAGRSYASKKGTNGIMLDIVKVVILFFVLKWIAGMAKKFIPTDVTGITSDNMENAINQAQNQVNSSNQPKQTLTDGMISQIAETMYDIIDTRNKITGSYDNFAFRKQAYLWQNSTDYYKTVVKFGVRPIKVGLFGSEMLTLPKVLILLDDEDKKELNKRALQKKLPFYL